MKSVWHVAFCGSAVPAAASIARTSPMDKVAQKRAAARQALLKRGSASEAVVDADERDDSPGGGESTDAFLAARTAASAASVAVPELGVLNTGATEWYASGSEPGALHQLAAALERHDHVQQIHVEAAGDAAALAVLLSCLGTAGDGVHSLALVSCSAVPASMPLLRSLADAGKPDSLQTLVLDDCHLDGGHLTPLKRAVSRLRSLKHLSLRRNDFSALPRTTNGSTLLSDFVTDVGLLSLDLGFCRLTQENVASILSVLTFSSLVFMGLDAADIRATTALEAADGLESNMHLLQLSLRHASCSALRSVRERLKRVTTRNRRLTLERGGCVGTDASPFLLDDDDVNPSSPNAQQEEAGGHEARPERGPQDLSTSVAGGGLGSVVPTIPAGYRAYKRQ